MITRLISSALFAGFAAGLIATLLQIIFIQPILLHAELFETGALIYDPQSGTPSHVSAPAFDFVRNGLSLLFSALVYTGYALILLACIAFAAKKGVQITTRQGILWGIAGFITFQFSPAIGLPPELPGSSAAHVGIRQIWWFSTAIATAISIGLLAFGKSWKAWGTAIVLCSLPHVIGAPHPEQFYGNGPPELAGIFAGRVLGVGLTTWIILGILTTYFWQKNEDNTSNT